MSAARNGTYVPRIEFPAFFYDTISEGSVDDDDTWEPKGAADTESVLAFNAKIESLSDDMKAFAVEQRNRMKELEKKVLRLEYTVVKPPPAPKRYIGTSKPNVWSDLFNYALGSPRYSAKYFATEDKQVQGGRIDLWAFLSIMHQRSLKDGRMEEDPDEIINQAIRGIGRRKMDFSQKADEAGISLAQWINDNLKV